MSNRDEQEVESQSDFPVRIGLIIAVVIGWVFEFVFAYFSQPTLSDGIRAFALFWFASGAAFFVGTLTGFVFGVPKTRSSSSPTLDATEVSRYRANTNLEEISDWLTKIIVGLGLVEFREVISFLDSISAQVGSSIDQGRGGAQVIALSSILYGFICGFMFYYIWTRVLLQKLLDASGKIASQHVEPQDTRRRGGP